MKKRVRNLLEKGRCRIARTIMSLAEEASGNGKEWKPRELRTRGNWEWVCKEIKMKVSRNELKNGNE